MDIRHACGFLLGSVLRQGLTCHLLASASGVSRITTTLSGPLLSYKIFLAPLCIMNGPAWEQGDGPEACVMAQGLSAA